ncbi:MAG: hypothetical protein SFU25_00710 [Candidatus Caenarcaniphilales bacterium]|nr:hypothetical protein [Candidatus Caenarcaniphilales bacterium]
MNSKSSQIEPTQEEILKNLTDLNKVNEELLSALKQNRNHLFEGLLNRRLILSEKLEAASSVFKTNTAGLSEELQQITSKVLDQDKELMIYLELKVQKLRGHYHKLNMISKNQLIR